MSTSLEVLLFMLPEDPEHLHRMELGLPRVRVVRETPYPVFWTMEKLEQIASQYEKLETEQRETPLVALDLKKEGYGQVLVKDESVNPTGTHKDRIGLAMAQQLAFEVKRKLNLYRETPGLYEQRKDDYGLNLIKRFSLITSGHGGIALSKIFSKYNLPPPKLLLDEHTVPEILQALMETNADIYLTDLKQKTLLPEDILKMTNNDSGEDLTSQNTDLLGYWRIYYQKLAEEIFSQNPEQIYAPYGSGNLYEGLISGQGLQQGKAWKCNIYGAEPENPMTKAVMLYAASKPYKYFDPLEMSKIQQQGRTGGLTGVYKISEQAIEDAHAIYQRHKISAGYSSAAALALYMTKYATNKDSRRGKTIIINTGRGIVKKDW